MDYRRVSRSYDIYSKYGMGCVWHSMIDHLLINHSNIYFDRINLEDFDKSTGKYNELWWISPDEIEYYQPWFTREFSHVFKSCPNAMPVLDGNWDRIRSKLKETIFFKSLESHFLEGLPWEETIFVKRRLDELEEGNASWGVDDRSDLEERFKRTDRLYRSIDQNGFLPASELSDENAEDLKVNIAREGSYIVMGGRHRLTIATLLELSEIPVRVQLRHKPY